VPFIRRLRIVARFQNSMEPPPAAPSSSSSSAVQSRVEATRIQLLNRCKLPPPQAPPVDTAPSTPFVLYWMQNSVRSKHSPALEHAAAVAAHLNVPLRVAYTFDAVSQDGNALTERHAYFLLQTLADAQKALREERNVTLAVVAPGNAPEVSVRALAADALAVVTDTSYLRRGITDRLRVAEALRADNKPFCAVEGDIVVPVEEVTDKAEHAARTIRPKITRHLGKYLVPLEPLSLDPKVQPKIAGGTRKWLSSAGLETLDVRSVDAAVASIAGLDCLAPRVSEEFFVGGETAAQETLARFLKERLDKYATGRNEPAMSLQSDLSPFLRVGAISPVDVALQTKAYAATQKTKAVAEGVSAFLEEMIIRRELGANMCWFGRDDYDVYERTVPQYARESLGLHKADPRPVIYSYEVLEAGLTGDTYWNTAQLELLVTGKVRLMTFKDGPYRVLSVILFELVQC
jgi:deoxyribodipyrimidine photo-lyase